MDYNAMKLMFTGGKRPKGNALTSEKKMFGLRGKIIFSYNPPNLY